MFGQHLSDFPLSHVLCKCVWVCVCVCHFSTCVAMLLQAGKIMQWLKQNSEIVMLPPATSLATS